MDIEAPDHSKVGKVHQILLFEPELALLVGLQVVSSKGEEEGALSDKFFGSLSQKIK